MKKKISKGFILEIAFIIASYVLLTILMKSGMLNRQYTALIVPVGVNIMLAVSLNLVTGFLGELSLGPACFMSIGAYTGALISTSM